MNAAGMNADEMDRKERNPDESGDAGFDARGGADMGEADMAGAGGQRQEGMPGQNGSMPGQDGGMLGGFEEFASGDASGDMGAAFGEVSGENSDAVSRSDLLICGISLLVLLAALAFAVSYHRKPRTR